MNCPNCTKEMKNKSYWHYGLGSWDMDYPDVLHEEYYCTNCRIKYINGDWTIPKTIERATEKQVKCVKFINRELGTGYEPLLKRQTWEFINKYLEEAKQSRAANFECWCEENAHWLPEYF